MDQPPHVLALRRPPRPEAGVILGELLIGLLLLGTLATALVIATTLVG